MNRMVVVCCFALAIVGGYLIGFVVMNEAMRVILSL